MDPTKQPKKAITPTPEELQALNKDLDEVLKKHSMVLQPALKVNSTGIIPELRVFKIVEETPKIVIPVAPAPQSEVDKKATN